MILHRTNISNHMPREFDAASTSVSKSFSPPLLGVFLKLIWEYLPKNKIKITVQTVYGR